MSNQNAKPLAYFAIESAVDVVFANLFSSTDDGHLTMGFSASSLAPSGRDNIESGVNFRDYILEGGVKYRLNLQQATFGCILGVEVFGENRLEYITPSIKHYLKLADIDAKQIAMQDPPPTSM